MNLRQLVDRKIILFLPLLVIGLEIAALLIYQRLDNIVHVDLYRYGLTFSLGWAEDYWNSYGIAIGSLIGSVILTGVTLILYYLYGQDRSVSTRLGCILYPVIAASFIAVSLYFVFHIDSIVHMTLYQYGLQFSQEWAAGYWIVTRATLALSGVAIAILGFMTFIPWLVTRD